MEIKHMPFGMHRGEDCGFQRFPIEPLAGERVEIGARLTGADGSIARLEWTADEERQADITGSVSFRENDDRPYVRFTMRLPETPRDISYRIAVGAAWTRWYSFSSLRETNLTMRDVVRFDEHRAVATFERDAIKLSLAGCNTALCAYSGDASFEETEDSDGIFRATDYGFFYEVKRFTSKPMKVLFPITVRGDKAGNIHSITLREELSGTRVYGLGERFDRVNQQDAELTLRVEEYFGEQGCHSYIPVPMMMTEAGAGLYNENLRTVRMGFEKKNDVTELTVVQDTPRNGLLFTQHLLFGTPVDMLCQYHSISGMAALPPKWTFGIWISANGWNCQAETMHQLDMLKKYDLPATALVLEAWSDEKTFYIWNDAHYDMRGGAAMYALKDMRFPKDGKWPDPKSMIEAFRRNGIHTVLWQIPVIKRAWEGGIPQLDADEEYAIAHRYCIMQADGEPYRITEGWFSGSLLLDFTNDEAKNWWFSKRQYLLDMGVEGFKTDGGEFLFDEEICLSSGLDGAQAHNAYPMQYIKAYNEFGGVTFSRAGYAGAQTMPIHWAGDQISTWEALRAQLCAGLSAGLSGILFWSFDIAGFAGKLPSAELYLRAVALGAFCPVMQWHSEPRDGQYEFTAESDQLNDRSPWNIAVRTGDTRVLPTYRRLAKLRMQLLDYLYEEARYAVSSSRPLMAHLMVDYFDDLRACDTDDEYMLGRELLVAPIITEGHTERAVYLPRGEWVEMFTHQRYTGSQSHVIPCEVGAILVFAESGESAERLYPLFQEAK